MPITVVSQDKIIQLMNLECPQAYAFYTSVPGAKNPTTPEQEIPFLCQMHQFSSP